MFQSFVMAALIEQASPGPAAAPQSVSSIHVWMDTNPRRIALQEELLQKTASDSNVSASKPKGSSLLKNLAIGLLAGAAPGAGQLAAQADAMNQAKSGSASIALKTDWSIEGAQAAARVKAGTLAFEITFSGAAGLANGQLVPVILKLDATPHSGRIVGKTEIDMARGGKGSIHFTDTRIPLRIVAASAGRMTVRSQSALPPGQYAIAFRPTGESFALDALSLAHAVTPSAADPAPWQIVWDFSVQ